MDARTEAYIDGDARTARGNFIHDAHAGMILNLLEVDGEELLSAEGEQPEFLSLEVCLDSGAGDHVLAEVDVPGYTVEPSPGSIANLHFVAAGGKRIKMQGQVNAQFATGSGEAFTSCFQVAAVTRPLWSVGRICEKGYKAIFDDKEAKIVDKQGVTVCLFQRVGGLYLGTMRLRNPHHKGFRRQSP
jgi:hypothetical protein